MLGNKFMKHCVKLNKKNYLEEGKHSWVGEWEDVFSNVILGIGMDLE